MYAKNSLTSSLFIFIVKKSKSFEPHLNSFEKRVPKTPKTPTLEPAAALPKPRVANSACGGFTELELS